ncbi:PepSY domain-containing protein [uncultured Intestinimonas sp.]|uniref:PepSY domain-containing protein n=1 Tax=uncultured Intestinimonas sp. TaxID=1689265 RepID=UPI0025EED8E3|nr:PepSY domain-containing protein [uncultured Intestinimonas sp.]
MKLRSVPPLCAAALIALSAAGCGQQSSQAEYIGIDAAKAIALEAAGVSESAAAFSTAGLDQQNGMDYYAVDFTANGQNYAYDIDAVTGVIIEGGAASAMTAVSDLPGGTAAATPDVQAQATPAAGTAAATPDVQAQATPAAGTAAPTPAVPAQPTPAAGTAAPTPAVPAQPAPAGITGEQAQEIALAHAGLTASQVTFVRSRLDYERGRQCYEVEFYTAGFTEYDYEIDASTGEILSYDFDAEGYVPPAAGSTAITADQAMQIALAEVPGAGASDIWEFEVDMDDGRLEYEGTIYYSGMEYEFTIDGYSGAIRGWEVESIYD